MTAPALIALAHGSRDPRSSATIEALVGQSLPGAWDDTEAVLVGTGRREVPVDAAALRERLPALG